MEPNRPMTDPFSEDKPREACGLFAIHGHPDAARLCYFGLYALQHRGQESAGIAVSRDQTIVGHKGMGLVPDVFDVEHMKQLAGTNAIGHVRYSTTGSSILTNAQPFVVRHRNKSYALAHNGNLVNAHTLKRKLEESGSIFQTTMDSEVFLHFFVKSLKLGFEDALVETVKNVVGAYSFVMMTSRGEIVGIKDPHGFRPLCIGKLNGNYLLASETCALDLVQAEFVREVEPGEIVIIGDDGLRSINTPAAPRRAFCIFEFIYFARPDSNIFGKNVYAVRKAHGRRLAREAPVKANLVMPFPDSGTYAGLGYSEASGIAFEMGMIRNHYVGRTFIQPTQAGRDFKVRMKYNVVRDRVEGQRVVVVDDSLVRGTTSRGLLSLLREAGAEEIHFRIASPPIRYPCHYGIDMPTREELLASDKSVDEIADHLGVDSLGYLSLEGMKSAVEGFGPFCDACWTGEYDAPLVDVEAGYATEGG